MKSQEIQLIASNVKSVEMYADESPRIQPSHAAPDSIVKKENPCNRPVFSQNVANMRSVDKPCPKVVVEPATVKGKVIPPLTTVLTRPPETDTTKPPFAPNEVKEEIAPVRIVKVEIPMAEVSTPIPQHIPVSSTPIDKPEEPLKAKATIINSSTLSEAISGTSNRIGDFCYASDLFNLVKEHIQDLNMTSEEFYDITQNSVFGSIVTYCGFERNKNIITIPANFSDLPCFPSLVFFNRIYNDTRVSFINTDHDKYKRDATAIMPEYRKIFQAYFGIQMEWIPFFKNRLKDKMPGLNQEGIEYITTFIAKEWCDITIPTPEGFKTDPTAKEAPVVKEEEKMVTETVEVTETTVLQTPVEPEIQTDCIDDCNNCQLETCINEGIEEDDADDDTDDDTDEDLEGFRIDVYTAGGDNPFDITGEYDCVMIRPDKDIAIPIYVKGGIDNIPLDICKLPPMGDVRNNVWDFLVHFPSAQSPFISQDPSECIEGLFDEKIFDAKVVILHAYEDGSCLMLPHYVDKDFGRVDSQEKYELLMRLNYLIQENIGDSDISHMKRTMSDSNTFITQEEAKAIGDSNDEDEEEANIPEETYNDWSSGGEDHPVEEDVVMAAALAEVGDEHLTADEIGATTVPFKNTNVPHYTDPDDEDDGFGYKKRSGGMNKDGTFTRMSKQDRKKKRDRYN